MGFQESGLRVSILGVAEFRRNAAAIRSDIDSFNRTLLNSEQAGGSFANTLNRVGTSLSHIGRTLSLTVTAPILGLGTSLLNAGIQFEDAFADVSKTVDGVSDKFGNLTTRGTELRTEIRQMALDIPVTAKELALLGGQAGQLGVSIEAMPEFLRTIADLGVATNMSAETAGDAIARFANIMGIKSAELGDFASRAGSAIVDLGNKSAATESDIVALAMRIAGAGRAVGMTSQEIIGMATSIAELGVQAEMGGSAASRILLDMQAAASETSTDVQGLEQEMRNLSKQLTDQFRAAVTSGVTDVNDLRNMFLGTELDLTGLSSMMSGFEKGTLSLDKVIEELYRNTFSGLVKSIDMSTGKLELFAKAAGVTTAEFKNLVKNSPTQAFYKLVKGLSEMQERGELSSDVLADMGLNTIRLRDLVNRLGPNMENLTENINTSNTAWSENTALTIEAEKKYKTIKNQLVIMKNAFNELGIVIFDLYRDHIAASIKKFTDFVKKLSELQDGTIKTIVKIALLVAALGPLLIIIGTLTQLVATAIGGLSLLGTTMGFLVAPIMLVVGAVAALGVAWKLNLGGIQEKLPEIVTNIADTAGWLKKAFDFGTDQPGGNFFTGIGQSIQALTYIYKDNERTFFGNFLKSFGMGEKEANAMGMAIRNKLTPTLLKLSTGFKSVGLTANTVWKDMQKRGPIQAMKTLFAGTMIKDTLIDFGISEDIAEQVQKILRNTLTIAIPIIDTLKEAFLSVGSFLLERVLPVIAEFAGWFIGKFAPGIIDVIQTAVIPLFFELAKTIGQLWEIVEPDLSMLYDWFTKKALPVIMNFITGTAIPVIKGLILAIKEIWELTSPYLVAFVTYLYAGLKYILATAIKSFIDNYLKPFIELVKGIWDAVKGPLGEFYDWFTKTALPEIRDFILNDIKSAFESFKTNITDLWENTKEFLGALYDWFMVTGLPIVLDYIQNNIIGGLKDLRQNIIDLWNNDVKTALQGFLDWVKDLPSKIEEQATNLVSAGKKLAGDLLNGILEAIRDGPTLLANALIDLLNGALNLIPDFTIDLGWPMPKLSLGIPDNPIPKFSAGATGGVLSGNPLLAGELGPEMFVPGSSGMLLSNNITNMLMNQPAPTSINNSRNVVNNFSPNLNGITPMDSAEDIGYELMRLYHMSQAQVIA